MQVCSRQFARGSLMRDCIGKVCCVFSLAQSVSSPAAVVRDRRVGIFMGSEISVTVKVGEEEIDNHVLFSSSWFGCKYTWLDRVLELCLASKKRVVLYNAVVERKLLKFQLTRKVGKAQSSRLDEHQWNKQKWKSSSQRWSSHKRVHRRTQAARKSHQTFRNASRSVSQLAGCAVSSTYSERCWRFQRFRQCCAGHTGVRN